MALFAAQEASSDSSNSNTNNTTKREEAECISKGSSLFVGSFNINSEDLTMAAAKAWLKHAADADIVALGLQECGTVPAKPFPQPTNGMARARWRLLKNKDPSSSTHSVSEGAEESAHLVNSVSRVVSGESGAAKVSKATKGSFGETREKTPKPVAEIVEAFKSCGTSKNKSTNKKHSGTGTEPQPVEAVQHQAQDAAKDSDSPETSTELVVESDDSADGERRTAFSDGRSAKGETMRRESYYLRGAVDERRDRKMLQNLADCIPGRQMVADVAMGETPTGGKIKVSLSPTMCSDPSSKRAEFVGTNCTQCPNGDGAGVNPLEGSAQSSGFCAMGSVPLGESKTLSQGRNEWLIQNQSQSESFTTVEWYGTIRLLVFVREEVYSDLTVRTVVIPSGDKPSCVPDAPQDYPKDTSPDKGAVACYLKDPSAQLELLMVNCHLFGTNKYGVGEAVFDKYRMAQLRAIDAAIGASLPDTALARMVLLGDLNFRVEVLSDEKDKLRGGNDFQAVLQVAEEGDVASLLDLYQKSDRLRLVLDRVGAEDWDDAHAHAHVLSLQSLPVAKRTPEVPPLLSRLEDGLGSALTRGEVVRPTFTFKPGDTSNSPRRYNNKRTPSWTDRILWRGLKEQEHVSPRSHHFAAVRDVISSDHEPVYCLLAL